MSKAKECEDHNLSAYRQQTHIRLSAAMLYLGAKIDDEFMEACYFADVRNGVSSEERQKRERLGRYTLTPKGPAAAKRNARRARECAELFEDNRKPRSVPKV